MNIKERSKIALNLEQYASINKPEFVTTLDAECPLKRQYILRMLIKEPFSDFLIPKELQWATELVQESYKYQQSMGLEHPFCYLTIRHGIVETKTDEVWHVDGFSMQITHLPEQNYLWSNICSTEYLERNFPIPNDFDPKRHNIHLFFQSQITDNDKIKTMRKKGLYVLDPYVVHRRPPIPSRVIRTLVRVSFTPIEIADINNTPNPLLPRNYTRDGVKVFRDKLVAYSV